MPLPPARLDALVPEAWGQTVREVGILRLGGLLVLTIAVAANGAFADIGAPWYAYVLLDPILAFLALGLFVEAQR